MNTNKLSYIARSLYNNQLFGWLKMADGETLCYYWEDGWNLATHRIQYNSKDFQILSFAECDDLLAQKENTEMTNIEQEMRDNIVEIFGERKNEMLTQYEKVVDEILSFKWEKVIVTKLESQQDDNLTIKIEGLVCEKIWKKLDEIKSKYRRFSIKESYVADKRDSDLNILERDVYDEFFIVVEKYPYFA